MWKLTLDYSIHKNVLLHVLQWENRSPKQDDDSMHCEPYQEIQIWLNGIPDGPWVMAWVVAMLDDVMRTMEHEHAWMLGPVSVFFFSFLWWGMGGNHPIRD